MGRRMWLARLPLEYIEKQDRSLSLPKNLKALCLLCIYLQRNKITLRVIPQNLKALYLHCIFYNEIK